MSELKARTARSIANEEEMLEMGSGESIEQMLVYPKSEADKVIAELQQKLAAAQQVLRLNEPKALYSNLETMGRLKHEIDVVARRERHHKYKRCLAMAEWCKRKRIDAADYRIPREKWDFYDKWHKRWQGLAEKFREAK